MAHETERERQGFAEPENRYRESDRILKTDDPGAGAEGIGANLKARIVMGVFDRREDAEATVRDLIRRHGVEWVVFSSDWPTASPAAEVEAIRALGLDDDETAAVLGGNMARLLGR